MSHYSISNGRALFRVKGLFDASVTLEGSDDQDRFFLLSVKFDFRITGLGKQKYKRSPEGQDRLTILDDGNIHLTPQSPAVDRSQDDGNPQIEGNRDPPRQDAEHGERMDLDVELGGDQVGEESMERKDGPLLRLYSFLRE